MEQSFLEFVVWELLRQYGLAAQATEAIAFRVDRTETGGLAFGLLLHHRPDDSDERERRDAVRAFEEVMRPCVDRGVPGASWVGNVVDERQYCLTVPFPRGAGVRLVFGLIVRAAVDRAAREKLDSLLRR
jgi:hypothetical protein